MTEYTKKKLVPANAVNFVVEINEVMNNNTRKGMPNDMIIPGMFDRAFLVFHEAGILPITEIVAVQEGR